MPWTGGVYTKANNATGGWVGDAAAGTGIEATRHDTQDNDFTTGITSCLNKDGSNAATANLNIGNFRLTSVGAATARTDAAQVAQVQNGDFTYLGTTGGSANTQTASLTPALTAYAAGQHFRFIAGFTNTGAATLNINSLGAKNIFYAATKSALLTNEIVAGRIYNVVYDGTQFLLLDITATGSFTADPVANNRVMLFKSRGTSAGTNTIVQSGDQLGGMWFYGANGTGYDPAAAIIGVCDGTPGATNDMPGALYFYTTADGSATLLERMRIASTGNVGIGTAPSASARLYAQSSTATNGSFAVALINSASTDLFNVRGDGLINTGLAAASPYNTTTASATNATLLNTGVLARSTSSLKYKTDIADATHGLAEVLQLRPVTYRGRNDGSTVFGGLIAEEVDAVGLSEFVVYDDTGAPDALAYGNMVSLAFKAIQELNAKVVALEQRVAELEA